MIFPSLTIKSISWAPSGIYVHQQNYVSNLLKRHNIFNYKRCNTPCTPATQFSKRNGNLLFDPSLHCSIVGALQYLTFTQPNISFGLNQFRKFVQALIDIHYECKLAHGPLYSGPQFSALLSIEN